MLFVSFPSITLFSLSIKFVNLNAKSKQNSSNLQDENVSKFKRQQKKKPSQWNDLTTHIEH
jgi:hypothetical protein